MTIADHLATAIAAGFEFAIRAALSANQAAVDAVCEFVAAAEDEDEMELDFAMFDLPGRTLPRVAVASSRSRDGWRWAAVRS